MMKSKAEADLPAPANHVLKRVCYTYAVGGADDTARQVKRTTWKWGFSINNWSSEMQNLLYKKVVLEQLQHIR